jgi:hypothetical protein
MLRIDDRPLRIDNLLLAPFEPSLPNWTQLPGTVGLDTDVPRTGSPLAFLSIAYLSLRFRETREPQPQRIGDYAHR